MCLHIVHLTLPFQYKRPYWVRFILALRRVLTPLSASWLTSRYRRRAPAAGRASCEPTRTYWAQPSARKQHRVLGNPFPRVRGLEKTGKNGITLKVFENWRDKIISLGGLRWWEMFYAFDCIEFLARNRYIILSTSSTKKHIDFFFSIL